MNAEKQDSHKTRRLENRTARITRRLENRTVRKLEDWKTGQSENKKIGKQDSQKTRRLEK